VLFLRVRVGAAQVSKITSFIRTYGLGQFDFVSNPEQEYVYFIRSKTLPSSCYIFSGEYNIPFYTTSKAYMCIIILFLTTIYF